MSVLAVKLVGMDITKFPPFRLSVAAADFITSFGGQLRISVLGKHLVFESRAPVEGDAIYGCPGLALGITPQALARVQGGVLDARTVGGLTRFEFAAADQRANPQPALGAA